MAAAVNAFPKGIAGGGNGLTATNLQEMLEVPATNGDEGFLGALTAFRNCLAKGHLPTEAAPWLAGGPLIPLRKRDGGVCPIAVADKIRRLIRYLCMASIAPAAHEFLEPHQVWSRQEVAPKRSSTAHEDSHAHGQDGSYGLRKVELKNAFNLISQRALLPQVRLDFHIHAWANLCYEMALPQVSTSDCEFCSVTCVQHGGPVGPFLLSLAFHFALPQL